MRKVRFRLIPDWEDSSDPPANVVQIEDAETGEPFAGVQKVCLEYTQRCAIKATVTFLVEDLQIGE